MKFAKNCLVFIGIRNNYCNPMYNFTTKPSYLHYLQNYNDITHTDKANKKNYNQLLLLLKHYSNKVNISEKKIYINGHEIFN